MTTLNILQGEPGDIAEPSVNAHKHVEQTSRDPEKCTVVRCGRGDHNVRQVARTVQPWGSTKSDRHRVCDGVHQISGSEFC